MEKMEYHRYTAIPIIDEQGKYAGTLTEGDLLWKMKNTPGLTFEGTERIYLTEVPRKITNNPVRIGAEIEDLLSLAIVQNFVPVVDDNDIFIGIIRRREIMEYYGKMLLVNNKEIGSEKNIASPKYLFLNLIKGLKS